MFIKRGIICSLLVALVVTLLPGCSTGSSSINIWPGQAERGSGRITGSTVASETISEGLRASDGLRGVMSIENASVWLQEHPEIRTTTAPDGSFVLENVPFGSYRVVSSFRTRDNKTYKARSTEVNVSEEAPERNVGGLAVAFAGNRVRIILRDELGKPLNNAMLTLWGEQFEFDGDGVYLSPPLPDSEKLEKVLLRAAGENSETVLVAAFSGDGTTQIKKTITGKDQQNQAPNVWLTSVKESGDKINPGEIVTLWAVYVDKNPEDLATMNLVWGCTGGTLASSAAAFPEDLKRRHPNVDWATARQVPVFWQAPPTPGNYKVLIDVYDSAGLNGAAQHPLNVHSGSGEPLPPPVNHPPVAEIIAGASVIAGQPLSFKVIASDPDLDFLRYEWSVVPAAGNFSGSTASMATWTAPLATGVYEIRCRVSEIGDSPLSVIASAFVQVVADPIVVRPGFIAGHVLDAGTRLPIPQAVVAISGTNIYRIADAQGYFEFRDLSAGTYTLIATKNGYQTRTYSGIVVPAS